ncbi:hypothetical protein OIU79_004232 [Salix purpurea]|uniref:Uncharacterized protein n=1 Tax=Salix purpurea TaxID=77065 RepID=A0A9Q0Z9A7_SALPP|nr:hypothetical protein OIU79_004232 [Salix purpurea]
MDRFSSFDLKFVTPVMGFIRKAHMFMGFIRKAHVCQQAATPSHGFHIGRPTYANKLLLRSWVSDGRPTYASKLLLQLWVSDGRPTSASKLLVQQTAWVVD